MKSCCRICQNLTNIDGFGVCKAGYKLVSKSNRCNGFVGGGNGLDSLRLCCHCGKMLPFERFYKNAKVLDGYNQECKDCSSARAINNYHKKYGGKRAGPRGPHGVNYVGETIAGFTAIELLTIRQTKGGQRKIYLWRAEDGAERRCSKNDLIRYPLKRRERALDCRISEHIKEPRPLAPEHPEMFTDDWMGITKLLV